MRGDQRELEWLARAVRRLAGLQEETIAMSPIIAERVMGYRVRICPTLSTSACIDFDDDPPRIYIREAHGDSNFEIAHELAHWSLRTMALYQGPHEERHANFLAAAILAPMKIVRAIHGSKSALAAVSTLANATMISQTAAHLRLAEVTGEERGIATVNGHKLARGIWISSLPLVEIARGERPNPGLVQARLRGGIDEGRTASIAKRRTGTK